MFSPEDVKEEARRHNPALDSAYRTAEQAKHDYLDPLIDYFGRLEQEVAGMTIARRFRIDKGPNLEVDEMFNPLVRGLSEAEFKRAQLLSDLGILRSTAMGLVGRVEDLVMDIEATKTD